MGDEQPGCTEAGVPVRTHPKAALVLETNNLRGGNADPTQVVTSLERLLVHLRAQTIPLARLHEVVITHDGIAPADQDRLEQAASVPLKFVRIPPQVDYYEAKNFGFEATTSAIVAFGDADCWPDPAWLEHLLAPFASGHETPAVVAGRTTYRRDWLGEAASTIDFMYFPSPLGAGCTRNFYANNVAFRRELFADSRYLAADGLYRGHCQVMGLALQAHGVPVAFEPRARTIHRFPDSAREFMRLRLLRGHDTTLLTPHLAKAYLPARLRWIGRTGRVAALVVLAIRLASSLRALGHQDMPRNKGWRHLATRAAALFAILGISAIDTVGALFGRPWRASSQTKVTGALSYHGNVDDLAS